MKLLSLFFSKRVCKFYVNFFTEVEKGVIGCGKKKNRKSSFVCKICVKRGSNDRHLIHRHMGVPAELKLHVCELRMQRFYLTFCDILHVTHLHYYFFNNVPIKLTKILLWNI